MTKRDRKKLYISLLPHIREVARGCGYAIGVHGSMTRDFDLIAVPWVEKPLLEKTLVKRITKAVDGFYMDWSVGKKPHGRNAHTIVLNKGEGSVIDGKRWAVFIDLSVTPTL